MFFLDLKVNIIHSGLLVKCETRLLNITGNIAFIT